MPLPNICDALELNSLCTAAPPWAQSYDNNWVDAWTECNNGAWLIWTVAALGMDRMSVLDLLCDIIDCGKYLDRIGTNEHLSDRDWATFVSNTIVMSLQSSKSKMSDLKNMAIEIRKIITVEQFTQLVEAFCNV